MNDEHWMRHAMQLAKKAEAEGEVPVGAVIVKDNELIAEGWNQSIMLNDPTAHAEVMALRKAGEKLANYRLPDTTLYVTLEPCAMCVSAMVHARIKRVVFAASDMRTGAMGGSYNLLNDIGHNHSFDIESGVLQDDCKNMLQDFFRSRR